MKQKFEVGDKVRAWGVDGVVVTVDGGEPSVRVKFHDDHHRWFGGDGRCQSWHKEPSLFLVEKAKKPEPNIKRFYERVGLIAWISDDGQMHNGLTKLGCDIKACDYFKTGRYFDWDIDANKIVGKVEVE